MKTFKHLSIGDSVYKAIVNPRDLMSETPICPTAIYKYVVESLQTIDGNIHINHKRTSYTEYSLLVLSKDDLCKTSVEYDPANSSGMGLFFIYKKDANLHVKKLVLLKIKECEDVIERTILHQNNLVKKLRIDYHEILNASYYPEFNAVESLTV